MDKKGESDMKKHKTKSIPMAVLMGLLLSLIVTVIGAAILTFLIVGERLAMESLPSAVVAVLLLAALIGAWVTIRMTGEKPLMMALLSGAVYLVSLLCMTALFFGGQYQGVPVTALVVLGSSLAAALFSLRRSGAKRKKRYRIG